MNKSLMTKGVEDGMGAKVVLCKFCHFTERNHIDGKYCSVNRIAEFTPQAPSATAAELCDVCPASHTASNKPHTGPCEAATTEVRGKASPEMEQALLLLRSFVNSLESRRASLRIDHDELSGLCEESRKFLGHIEGKG